MYQVKWFALQVNCIMIFLYLNIGIEDVKYNVTLK
jgi:hypothetical protein